MLQKCKSDSASVFHQSLLNLAKSIQLNSVSELLDQCNLINIIATLRIRFERSKSHFLKHNILLGMLEIAGSLPQQTPTPVLRLLLLAFKEIFCCCSCFVGNVLDGIHRLTEYIKGFFAVTENNLENSTALAQDLIAELLIMAASIASWRGLIEEDTQYLDFGYLHDFKPCLPNLTFDKAEYQYGIDKVQVCLQTVLNGGIQFVCPTYLQKRIHRIFPDFVAMPPPEQLNVAIKVLVQNIYYCTPFTKLCRQSLHCKSISLNLR